MAAVETCALHREFVRRSGRTRTKVEALGGVDLCVEEGEVRGLLGPNGAGKTTLAKILSTVLIPTSGTASVFGMDVVAQARGVRQVIGLVFGGDRGLYTRLTARQNLDYWAALYDVPAAETPRTIDRLLARVGLTERADERVETYSRGMKQRLHMARGLVSNPRLLILDEPTIGLDVVAARSFRGLITELRDAGVTILLTTHDMNEAEAVCDQVSVMDHGHLLATEAPATIGRWAGAYEWVEVRGVPDDLVAVIIDLPGVAGADPVGDGWTRFRSDADGVAAQIVQTAVGAGHSSIRTGHASLEEVYLRLFSDRGVTI
jgi:ABC-2 type transport system ATP-binding protein